MLALLITTSWEFYVTFRRVIEFRKAVIFLYIKKKS
jgi:hypothetical protein